MELNNFSDHAVLLVPPAWKEAVLRRREKEKTFRDVRILSLEEFRDQLYFSWDVKAWIDLAKMTGRKPSNALEMLQNMAYVEDREYGEPLLDELVRRKRELGGDLVRHPLFAKSLRGYSVYAYGYGKLDRFRESMVERFAGKVLPFEEKKRKYAVRHFPGIAQETEAVFCALADLLAKGVDVNDLFVMNASEEYEPYLRRYSGYFGIPLEQVPSEPLYGTMRAKEFFDRIGEKTPEEIYDWLEECGDPASLQLQGLLNTYAPCGDLKALRPFLEEDCRRRKLPVGKEKNVVRRARLYDPLPEGAHVFFLGFNDRFPAVHRDIEYIPDRLRGMLGMSDSVEENELEKENALAYLSGIDHLSLSYCDTTPFEQHRESPLLERMDHEIVEGETSFLYAEKLNRERYGAKLDDQRKYGGKDEALADYYATYGECGYCSYNNAFNGLDEAEKEELGKGRKLSYTSLDEYYACAFRYGLDRVYGIAESEDTLALSVGSIFHKVLMDAEKEGFDFEKSYRQALEQQDRPDRTAMERFFLERLKEECRLTVSTVWEMERRGILEGRLLEQPIEIPLPGKLSLQGRLDKVLFHEEDGVLYAAVVDYKTGNPHAGLQGLPYGFGMQLPIYLCLLQRNGLAAWKGKKIAICGLYLQPVLPGIPRAKDLEDSGRSEAEQRKWDMRLKGQSSSDPRRIAMMDREQESGEESTVLYGMKRNGSGELRKGAPVLSDEDMDKVAETAYEKAAEAEKKILEGEFVINPKYLGGKNQSCGYCPFSEICYRSPRDNVYLDSVKEEQENDEDAEMD